MWFSKTFVHLVTKTRHIRLKIKGKGRFFFFKLVARHSFSHLPFNEGEKGIFEIDNLDKRRRQNYLHD